MSKQYTTWGEFYQRYMLIYNAIIALSLFPFVWIFLELERGSGGLEIISGQTLYYFDGALIIVLSGLLWVTRKRGIKELSSVPKEMRLSEKLGKYSSLKTRKFLAYEAVAVVAMVLTYLNSDYVFVLFYLFILFLFSLDRPRYEHIVKDLRLSKEEQNIIESQEPFG